MQGNRWIGEEQFQAMISDNNNSARIYLTFQVVHIYTIQLIGSLLCWVLHCYCCCMHTRWCIQSLTSTWYKHTYALFTLSFYNSSRFCHKSDMSLRYDLVKTSCKLKGKSSCIPLLCPNPFLIHHCFKHKKCTYGMWSAKQLLPPQNRGSMQFDV